MNVMGSRDVPILILDDDAVVLHAWQSAAKVANTKVATYASVGDALEHLARRAVCACVADWDLGDRTSLDFLRILRSRRPELPIYVVAAEPETAARTLDDAGLHVPVFPKAAGAKLVLESLTGRVSAVEVA